MSDPTYGFLSVLRRGLSALIAANGLTGDVRVSVPVSLSVGGTPAPSLPAIALRGPGDVIGFDGASVRRTWPAAHADNAESNYFALVEFSEADLPWRYSPDATSGDRLVPWICLLVVEDGEIGGRVPSSRARPLAAVTLTNAPLPDLSQAWAWAHAQVLGAPDLPATDFTADAIRAVLASNPSRITSRLLCPRQLKPLTSYQAFVVPTFERGRLAGLGQSTAGVARLAAAFQPGQPSVTLPVYYTWSFRTGEAGDFGSLVARLQPVRDMPASVWKRPIAVSPPGVNPPNWQIVDLQSMLVPVGASVAEWNTIDAHGFTAALAQRVNVHGPILEPPLYGRWLAAAEAMVTPAPPTKPWFHHLNADPRIRVAAGLGTTVVQNEQQELLAGAWAQVDGIRAANERLRLAQLARELALRVYARHFAAVTGDAFLQVSAPLHRRVRQGAVTIGAQLDASPIAVGALAPVFRKVARPLGSLGVRQKRLVASPMAAATGAFTRMNSGALAIAPPPQAAAGSNAAVKRLGDLAAVFKKVNVAPDNLHAIPMPGDFVVRDYSSLTTTPITTIPIAVTPTPAPDGPPVHPPVGPVHPVGPVQPPVQPPIHTGPITPTPPVVALPPATTVTKDVFRNVATTLMTQLAAAPAAGSTLISANLDTTRNTILARLHPVQTIETPLKDRLGVVDGGPRRADPIEPVMAAPAFPQPMYKPLTELGREWLLPGLDEMPADSVGLFLTNWRFVESYLTGLNHEMARKLLWNGYPTDQRGTYFRQFWDPGPGATTDGDFGPIHAWTSDIGQNRTIGGDPLVLLLRGELIRRYPNVIVYAAAAEPDAQGRYPGSTEKHPIFFGRVEPDVALFGFDLDREVARGNPGWFFVLSEHPSEPRFGLAATPGAFAEQPANWQALGWRHLAASEQELAALQYVDLNATLPKNPTSADNTGATWHATGSQPSRAADLAHITFRQPKRFAVHGSRLIPAVPPSPGGPP